jgi:hypothetical protein
MLYGVTCWKHQEARSRYKVIVTMDTIINVDMHGYREGNSRVNNAQH